MFFFYFSLFFFFDLNFGGIDRSWFLLGSFSAQYWHVDSTYPTIVYAEPSNTLPYKLHHSRPARSSTGRRVSLSSSSSSNVDEDDDDNEPALDISTSSPSPLTWPEHNQSPSTSTRRTRISTTSTPPPPPPPPPPTTGTTDVISTSTPVEHEHQHLHHVHQHLNHHDQYNPAHLLRDRTLDVSTDNGRGVGSWQESLNRQRETDARQIESRLMDSLHHQHNGSHHHGGAAAEAGSIDVARFSHFLHSALTRTRIGYHSASSSVSSAVAAAAGTANNGYNGYNNSAYYTTTYSSPAAASPSSSSTNQSSSNHSRFSIDAHWLNSTTKWWEILFLLLFGNTRKWDIVVLVLGWGESEDKWNVSVSLLVELSHAVGSCRRRNVARNLVTEASCRLMPLFTLFPSFSYLVELASDIFSCYQLFGFDSFSILFFFF